MVPGRTAARTPRATVTGALGRRRRSRRPARAGSSVSPRNGIGESVGDDTCTRPVQREQRDQLARRTRERARRHARRGRVRGRAARRARARVALVTEQEQPCKQVVEAAARIGDDHDACGTEPERAVERELEVGRVFRLRVTLDAATGRLDRGEARRVTESKSPTATVDLESERERARRHPRRRRRLVAPAGRRSLTVGCGTPAATTTMVPCSPCTRSSAGITQIRFAGRRRGEPPSQPGCPSSPYRSPDPSCAWRENLRVRHGCSRACFARSGCRRPSGLF